MTTVADKARAAAYLLADETFKEVMADLRDETLERWRNTASGSASLRELYWFEIHALDAVEGELKRRVEDAEVEAAREQKAAENAARKRR